MAQQREWLYWPIIVSVVGCKNSWDSTTLDGHFILADIQEPYPMDIRFHEHWKLTAPADSFSEIGKQNTMQYK